MTSKRFFLSLTLVAVCFVSYAGTLSHGFILDDFIILFGHKGVENRSLGNVLTDYQNSFYRPAGHVLLWIESRVFGRNAAAYHGVNLALFAVIGLLFFALVRRWTKSEETAFLTALFYCLHPINSMLVNYVTANVISTFLIALQLSFLFFLFFDENRRPGYLYVSLLFYVIGLFSHEMALVFPVFIASYLFFIRGQRAMPILKGSAPYLLAAAAYFIFRLICFNLKGPLTGMGRILSTPAVYATTFMDLLQWYFFRLLVPRHIIFLWTGDVARFYLLPSLLGLAGLAAGAGYLLFVRWRQGVKPFALSVFLAGLVPAGVTGFMYYPFCKPFLEPHWFYFSSIGFFLLAVTYLTGLKKKISGRLWVILVLTLAAANVVLLSDYNGRWRDQETYCRWWLSLNERNLTPYYGLGKSLMEQGKYKEAITAFRDGIQTSGIYNAMTLAEMGYAEFLYGRDKYAMHYYKQVLEMESGYAPVHYYLSKYYWKQNRKDKALREIAKAVALDPRNEEYKTFESCIRGGGQNKLPGVP